MTVPRPRHRLLSPRARPLLFAGVVIAILAAGGAVTAFHSRKHTEDAAPTTALPPLQLQADAPSPPPSQSTPQSAATAILPPCQTATATNCDKGDATRASACAGTGPAMIVASPIDLDEIAFIQPMGLMIGGVAADHEAHRLDEGDLDEIAFIQPMGLMIGGHVTPIDHGYFYIKGATEQPPRQAAVKSPLAGIITSVTRTARHGPNGDYDDYAVTIAATCTFRVRFSNLLGFAGNLAGAIGPLQPDESATPNYRVRQGELIGYTGMPTAYGIDVWVENDESTLTGFINPQQYASAESWKPHMVDLFDYTAEPLRSQLLALDMRDACPRWGKIDYDVDGTLAGNWFRQGSGGYGGNRQGSEGYWDGHLAVVYDGNDPGQIVISFGNFDGEPRQFAVIGNAPDPAAVTEATGVVVYQLGQIVTYSGDTGELWDHRSYIPHVRTRAGDSVEGTVLMQLAGPRQLRMEAFPGRAAAEITGFDGAALIYER